MKKRSILFLGGDLRQYYMAKSLIQRGFAISYYGALFPQELPAVRHCKDKEEVWAKLMQKNVVLVLPSPATADGMHIAGNGLREESATLVEALERLKCGHMVFGGAYPAYFWHAMEEKRCLVTDLSQNDRFVMKNTAAMAEGAVIEAALLSDNMLCGSRSLVIGFDCLGEMLARRLRGMKSQVTVMSQKRTDCLHAKKQGYESVLADEITKSADKQGEWAFRFVFQTDECPVLTDRHWNAMPPDVVILDLSPVKKQVDLRYASRHGMTAKHVPDLPGKFAAKAVGETMAQLLWEALQREEASGEAFILFP